MHNSTDTHSDQQDEKNMCKAYLLVSVFLFIFKKKIIIDSTSYWPRKHFSFSATMSARTESSGSKWSKGEAKIIIK